MKSEDLTGRRFGRLTVIEPVIGADKKTAWRCLCDCGNTHIVKKTRLTHGNVQSCGCLHREMVSSMFSTHGHSGERLYNVWSGMKRRCYNKNDAGYKNYGGRGISVCDEWLHDYMSFRSWALESGYDAEAKPGDCTLDRINNDGNYEPANCRWVNRTVQANNQRPRKLNGVRQPIVYKGKTYKSYSQLTEEYGFTLKPLSTRMSCGMSLNDAMDDIIQNPYPKRWTKNEDKIVLTSSLSVCELAGLLGRSEIAIRNRRTKLRKESRIANGEPAVILVRREVLRSDGKRYKSANAAALDVISENGGGVQNTIGRAIRNACSSGNSRDTLYGYGWSYADS